MEWTRDPIMLLRWLPPLMLLLFFLAETVRWRRIRRFGDPKVLGVSFQFGRRTAGILLLLAAVSLICTLLAEEGSQAGLRREVEPGVTLLLDSTMEEDRRTWLNEFHDALELGLSQESVPSATNWQLLSTADLRTAIVPATLDRVGFLALTERRLADWKRHSDTELARGLLTFLNSRLVTRNVAAFTGTLPAQSEELRRTFEARGVRLWFFVLQGAAERAQDGPFHDATDPARVLQAFDSGSSATVPEADTFAGWSLLQLLALVAAALLSIEALVM